MKRSGSGRDWETRMSRIGEGLSAMQTGSRDFIFAFLSPTKHHRSLHEPLRRDWIITTEYYHHHHHLPKQTCLQRKRQRKPARLPGPHLALPILLLAHQIGPLSPLFFPYPTFPCKLFSPLRCLPFVTFSPLPSAGSSSISSRPLLCSIQLLRNPKKGRR